MKFGICTPFQREGLLVPHLGYLQKTGFDYLELSLTALSELTDSEFETFSAYLRDNGMPVLACNCFVGGGIPLTGPQFSPHVFERYVARAVNRAGRLGVKKLILGSGGARNVPASFPMDKAREQLEVALDIILSQTKPQDIQLELEHLNRQESNIVTTFRESSDLVLRRHDPAFKSVFDYFHFALGNEDLSLITQRAGTIGHIHFARPLGRVYPSAQDLPELQPVFDAIRLSGYNDTFSMECAFPELDQEPFSYWVVLEEIKRRLSK